MPIPAKIKHISAELKGHAPFTIFGALMGIVFMILFTKIGKPQPTTLFSIFHPAHVILSAMVTASLFRIHEKKHIILVFIIGYFGSIGVATLSDCVVPYIGENLLGLEVPTHADIHPDCTGHENESQEEHAGHTDCDHEDEHADADHDTKRKLYLGFIEEWYIVNPAAILGILIALMIPRTKFPHAAHVLISTWASSAHVLMNSTGNFSLTDIGGIFVVLFIAVWLPCCISDIIFPLMFVNSDLELVSSCTCNNHTLHSHDHIHQHSEECGGSDQD